MTLGPRQDVDGAPAAPPRYGLIQAARDALAGGDPTNGRWQNGLAWEPEACGVGEVKDPCDANPNKETNANRTIREFDPVALVVGDRCSSFDVRRDWQARARRKLLACQSKLLAEEFWNGALARSRSLPNAFLAQLGANTITTSPVNLVDGLSCLEEALADCGCGRGMIHATVGTTTWWRRFGLIDRVGDQLLTINGTVVVADAGYTGDGPTIIAEGGAPDTATSGSVWAYGTDMVDVRLGPIRLVPDAEDLAGAVDRTDNLVEFRAERLAAVTFDGCCHVAAELDLDICASLAGS